MSHYVAITEAIVPAVISVGSVALALNLRKRPTITAIDPELMSKLLPFAGMPINPRHFSSDEVWVVIGGRPGVKAIFIAAGTISSLMARQSETVPELKTANDTIMLMSFGLRALAILSYIEDCVHSYALFLPRIMAWALARYYVLMISIYEAAQEMLEAA